MVQKGPRVKSSAVYRRRSLANPDLTLGNFLPIQIRILPSFTTCWNIRKIFYFYSQQQVFSVFLHFIGVIIFNNIDSILNFQEKVKGLALHLDEMDTDDDPTGSGSTTMTKRSRKIII